MSFYSKLPEIRLDLFDGAAAAAAGGAVGTGAQGGANGAGSAGTQQGKTGEAKPVLYGRQPEDGGKGAPDAGESKEAEAGAHIETTSNTLEERKKAYRDLVNGEYKDLYTQDTQRIINGKVRQNKELTEQLGKMQPVIDLLAARYGIEDGNLEKLSKAVEADNTYWAAAAEEAGMDVDQYKRVQLMQRELTQLRAQAARRDNEDAMQRQFAKWDSEAQEVAKLYKGFDLRTECQDKEFLAMLRSGVPVQTAYEVRHMDDIKAGIAAMQAKATEKAVVDGIRAKGARPAENGTASQSAFTVKDDVSRLTRADREEIVRRAARGEIIKF